MNSNVKGIIERKNNALILVWNFALWNQAIRYLLILIGAESHLNIALRGIFVVSIILYLYGIIHYKKIVIKRSKSAYVPLIVGAILIVTYMCNSSNSYIETYLVNYFQYIFFPLVALVGIDGDCYVNFIKIYFDFALVFFVSLGFAPLLHPDLFTNAMAYGFAISLPCGIAFYIGRHYLNRKWIIPFEISCYFMGAISSNRSTILSFGLMIIIYNLILQKTTVKRALMYSGGIVAAFIACINLPKILSCLIDFLGTHLNYHSRSLSFLYMGITGDTTLTGGYSNFLSGRDIIHGDALQILKNNFLTGMGIGGFENTYGTYSHNIFLDFALNWGILGIVIFFIIIVYSIKTICQVDKGDFSPQTGMLLLIFCLWCPKLFFSVTFITDLGFWSFLIMCIKINQKKTNSKYQINEEIQASGSV